MNKMWGSVTPYVGPSRSEILFMIARYNSQPGHAPKIRFEDSAFTHESESTMISARVQRDMGPRTEEQQWVDLCIKEFRKFKLHLDGYSEFKSEDWDRAKMAAITMVNVAESGRRDFLEKNSGAARAAEQRERDVEREKREQKEWEMQRKRKLEDVRREQERLKDIERDLEVEMSREALEEWQERGGR